MLNSSWEWMKQNTSSHTIDGCHFLVPNSAKKPQITQPRNRVHASQAPESVLFHQPPALQVVLLDLEPRPGRVLIGADFPCEQQIIWLVDGQRGHFCVVVVVCDDRPGRIDDVFSEDGRAGNVEVDA